MLGDKEFIKEHSKSDLEFLTKLFGLLWTKTKVKQNIKRKCDTYSI